MFLNILNISRISLFWTFLMINQLSYLKVFHTAKCVNNHDWILILVSVSNPLKILLDSLWNDQKKTRGGNAQKFRQMPPSIQPSHFLLLLCFLRLRFKHAEYKGSLPLPENYIANFHQKVHSAGIIAWKIKPYPSQPRSHPTAKLKSLYSFLRDQRPPPP